MATEITFTVDELFRELHRWLSTEALVRHDTALRAGDNAKTVKFLQEMIGRLPVYVKALPPIEEMKQKVAMEETLGIVPTSLRARYVRWRQMVDFLHQPAVVGQ
ncbi:MAG: hypothetical protein Q7S57_01545 [bacterium]|nr:hypothetical protein [bacterium]